MSVTFDLHSLLHMLSEADVKCCSVAGLFVNVAYKVFVATKDGEEILIVELAEFVASLKSANEGATTA